MNFNIWEGIYDNFKQCPKQGKGFESDRWVSQQLRRINKLLDSTKENQAAVPAVTYRMSLLPFLTALLSEKGNVDILDFGQVLRVPPGVAHGCKCISGPANLFYITSNIYDPSDEGRISYNDSEIRYDWLKDQEIK